MRSSWVMIVSFEDDDESGKVVVALLIIGRRNGRLTNTRWVVVPISGVRTNDWTGGRKRNISGRKKDDDEIRMELNAMSTTIATDTTRDDIDSFIRFVAITIICMYIFIDINRMITQRTRITATTTHHNTDPTRTGTQSTRCATCSVVIVQSQRNMYISIE